MSRLSLSLALALHYGERPSQALSAFRYVRTCSPDCDWRLWTLGHHRASTAETGERASDETAYLEPRDPCGACGALTSRLRLVRR